MAQTTRAPRKPKAPVEAEAVAEGGVSELVAEETRQETEVAPEPPEGVTEAKYVACRTLTVKGRKIKAGEPVPEAEGWPRVETWVNHGYIKAITPRGL